jgi:hypothetical protein
MQVRVDGRYLAGRFGHLLLLRAIHAHAGMRQCASSKQPWIVQVLRPRA